MINTPDDVVKLAFAAILASVALLILVYGVVHVYFMVREYLRDARAVRR